MGVQGRYEVFKYEDPFGREIDMWLFKKEGLWCGRVFYKLNCVQGVTEVNDMRGKEDCIEETVWTLKYEMEEYVMNAFDNTAVSAFLRNFGVTFDGEVQKLVPKVHVGRKNMINLITLLTLLQ